MKFELFLLDEIVTFGLFVVRDRFAALLGHFAQYGYGVVVVDISPGIYLLLLYRGQNEAQGTDFLLLAAFKRSFYGIAKLRFDYVRHKSVTGRRERS